MALSGWFAFVQAVLGLLDGMRAELINVENAAINVLTSLPEGTAKAAFQNDLVNIRDRYDR
jgi:hypothetical protein